MSRALADLETLVLEIRSARTRELFAEAVAAYQARAYRAAVVQLWSAVVYDLLEKLEELGVTGVQGAQEFVDHYRTAIENQNYPATLSTERNLLKDARSRFDLLGESDAYELTRLQSDRNRCAHLVMSTDELYVPSPESVRAHLRTAVERLMKHRPAQSAKAVGNAFDFVLDQYTPAELPALRGALKHRYFLHAKPSFIRNFVLLLLKNILQADLDLADAAGAAKKWKLCMALRAACELAPEAAAIATNELKTRSNDIQGARVINLILVIIGLPALADDLNPSSVGQIEMFVRSCDLSSSTHVEAIARIADVPRFINAVTHRVESMSRIELLGFARHATPEPRMADRLVALVVGSGSYRHAEANVASLVRYASVLTATHVGAIANAYQGNVEVREAAQCARELANLVGAREVWSSECIAAFNSVIAGYRSPTSRYVPDIQALEIAVQQAASKAGVR